MSLQRQAMPDASSPDRLCVRCSDMRLDLYLDQLRYTPHSCTYNEIRTVQDLGDLRNVNEHTECSLCRVLAARLSHMPYNWDEFMKIGPSVGFTFQIQCLRLRDDKLYFQVGLFDLVRRRNLWYDSFLNEHVPILVNTLRGDHSLLGRGGRQVRATADFDLLKGWVTRCQTCHKDCSVGEHQNWKPDFQMVVIECESQVTQNYRGGMCYTALSYVWGKLQLQADHPWPDLILDAIEVTKRLGLRYLWVDRYCISDDNIIKHKQIKNMDLVYQHAYLTIVSLGPDPMHGLPGVRPSASRTEYPKAQVGDYELIATPPPPERYFDLSKWKERGWTFQEGVLSRRIVVFTEDQMHFECRELVRNESRSDSSAKELGRNRQSMFKNFGVIPWRTIWWLVAEYADKHLTYDDDAFNAISGIFHAFERSAAGNRHCWGIPIVSNVHDESAHLYRGKATSSLSGKDATRSSFVIGLLWRPGFDAGRCTYTRRPTFPSWSWLGWQGSKISNHSLADLSDLFLERCKGTLTWIEFIDGSWLEVGNITNETDLSDQSLSHNIHLLAWVTPIELSETESDSPSKRALLGLGPLHAIRLDESPPLYRAAGRMWNVMGGVFEEVPVDITSAEAEALGKGQGREEQNPCGELVHMDPPWSFGQLDFDSFVWTRRLVHLK